MSAHGPAEKPPITEAHVESDFVNAIDQEVVSQVGYGSGLRGYEWGHEQLAEDTDWPFTVVRDGRMFEVDIDVRVTELTPERVAAREAQQERVLAMLKAAGVKPEAKP